jgi:hypothetical protein
MSLLPWGAKRFYWSVVMNNQRSATNSVAVEPRVADAVWPPPPTDGPKEGSTERPPAITQTTLTLFTRLLIVGCCMATVLLVYLLFASVSIAGNYWMVDLTGLVLFFMLVIFFAAGGREAWRDSLPGERDRNR